MSKVFSILIRTYDSLALNGPGDNNGSKLKEIDLLLKLNRLITSTLDLEKILQVISDGMAELLEIETAAIYLVEDDHKMYLGATTPPLPENTPEEVRWASIEDHPHCEKALKTGRSVVVKDFRAVDLSPQERRIVELRHLRSLIFLPLKESGECKGLLILGTSNKTRIFTDQETEMASGLADQLSVGIANARLHLRIRKQNAELLESLRKRKIVEKELKRSRAHLSNSLYLSKVGHWEYDVASGKYTFTDEFYSCLKTNHREQGGYTMTVEQYAERFVHEEDRHMVGEEIEKSLQTSDPDFFGEVEHRMYLWDGTPGYFMVRYSVEKDEEGKTVRILGANQDITQQKQFEETLKDALRKARESDRLKSAFLANISHEIRTPLNAILGFSGILAKENLPLETKDKFSEIIDFSGNRLLRIINNILDLSRIESGNFNIKPAPCDLNEMLEKLLNEYSITTHAGNTEFELELGLDEKEAMVQTDETSVLQVLGNLIDNAIKFTDSGTITIGYLPTGNKLTFYVKDTGIGIDPADHEKIFYRFSQVDMDYFESKDGAGLGLSIVKGIIDLMGGSIRVESELGKGSAFYFTIPYEKSGKAMKNKAPAELGKKEDRVFKVLVAEDEESNYLYLETILRKFNCTILHAWDGIEAVSLFKENPDTDLIFMDIKMPLMSGIDATQEIRALDKNIPIAAQTAYAMDADKALAMNVGCNYFLTKPIPVDEIINVIRKEIN